MVFSRSLGAVAFCSHSTRQGGSLSTKKWLSWLTYSMANQSTFFDPLHQLLVALDLGHVSTGGDAGKEGWLMFGDQLTHVVVGRDECRRHLFASQFTPTLENEGVRICL